jgi:hypothetical protein
LRKRVIISAEVAFAASLRHTLQFVMNTKAPHIIFLYFLRVSIPVFAPENLPVQTNRSLNNPLVLLKKKAFINEVVVAVAVPRVYELWSQA